MSRTMKIDRVRTYHLRNALRGAAHRSRSRGLDSDLGRALGPRATMAARAFPWPLEEPRLAAEPLKRAGDIIEVPQRPGLGLEVDRSMRERYSIATGDVTR